MLDRSTHVLLPAGACPQFSFRHADSLLSAWTMFHIGSESPQASDDPHGYHDELTVFGDFDPDDPDFAPQPQPASRPRSRQQQMNSGSRNSSSSSLRRIASNNSIGTYRTDSATCFAALTYLAIKFFKSIAQKWN